MLLSKPTSHKWIIQVQICDNLRSLLNKCEHTVCQNMCLQMRKIFKNIMMLGEQPHHVGMENNTLWCKQVFKVSYRLNYQCLVTAILESLYVLCKWLHLLYTLQQC